VTEKMVFADKYFFFVYFRLNVLDEKAATIVTGKEGGVGKRAKMKNTIKILS
jgi:hypothetical protein